ncbi:MAG: HAD family hydrolase [Terriglobales bacterium]|jgi:putative hydrolase of the HAD superfamily
MNSKLKVIFFDVGNTLLFPNRQRIHASLAERGIVPDSEHLRDLECRTKNRFDGIMAGRITKNGSPDHGFWWMFYSQLLSEIGLKDTDEADAIRDQLVAGIQNSGNWDTIRPGTAEQLNEIGESYQIAVISNADGKIADVLQKCGIANCFRTITDSGLVGYEKPHPEIFRQALKSMNAAPEESLYVGDVYSVDYLGATGAGMQALLMDIPDAYRDKEVPRVESLAELQKILRGKV